jgi:hypothetical protein
VTLVLEESAPGVAAAPPGFSLDDLDDVTLAALADGQMLVYDAGTGQWRNETVPAAHDPVTVLDSATVDLGLSGQQITAAVIPGGISHAALANLGVGDPHPQYALDTDLTAGFAGKSNTGHTHAAGDVTSGQFAIARLASGSPDGTKFIRDDGVLATPAGGSSPLVYVSTTVEQFVNTLALSDFTNRYTIPANNAAVGRVYRLTARGIVNNGSGNARTFTFAIRLGGVTIGSFAAISLAATTANKGYEIRADLIVVSTGAGGTVELQGVAAANGVIEQIGNTARASFDTTAAKTLGVAVTMSAANASVNTDQRMVSVEVLG